MPKKKRTKKTRLGEYDLDDVFRREASDVVRVMFHTEDPGYALSARVYPGNAAHTILKILEPIVEGAGRRQGWGEERIRRAVEEEARVAFVVFTEQLEHKLREALLELVFEAVAQTARTASRGAPGGDDPELMGETEWFNFAMRAGDELKKRRLTAPRRGPRAEWTPERRAEFLRRYKGIHKQVKGAVRIYRAHKGADSWLPAARAAYPDLREMVLDNIPKRNYMPSDMAREAAAEEMGLTDGEYLRRMLSDARAEASEDSENR